MLRLITLHLHTAQHNAVQSLHATAFKVSCLLANWLSKINSQQSYLFCECAYANNYLFISKQLVDTCEYE